MLLEKALKNKENQDNHIIPKVIEPIRIKEEKVTEVDALPKAAGGEKIDWSKGIERLKEWKKEKENHYF